MKDFIQIWNRVAGRTYSAVNVQQPKEDVRRNTVDTSVFEANFSECESLNLKFDNENGSFASRRNAIVNRLFDKRQKGHFTRLPRGIFMLLMLGMFGIAAACLIITVHPYDILFKLKVVLSEGGEIFEIWRKPEVNLYLRVYLFNVTNKEAFMAGREKLNVQEVGPYVYKEHLEHRNVTFNTNGTLSAMPSHPLTWEAEMSGDRSEDDVLVLPNIALLSIGDMVSKQNILTRFGLNALIRSTRTQPLLEMTAKEFMFGYESSLVTLGNSFMPGWIRFDKLGLIDRMYDFTGDYETVFTGESDPQVSGLLATYKGSDHLPQWNGDHCSLVTNSSDGTKFKSGYFPNETHRFYRKSLCRTALLRPVRKGERKGLTARKYTFVDNMLDNGKMNAENKCYCRYGKCLEAGLIDVTDCYYGFPIALSYPHFYNGSNHLQNQVDGLYPRPADHESYFWVQPESGLPMDLAVRFQINMAMNDVSAITNCERFANLVLPLLWFEIRMFELPDKMANHFWLYLNVLPVVENVATYLLFIGGVILTLISLYKILNSVYCKSFERKTKHNNLIIGAEMWSADDNSSKRRNSRENFKPVYIPCEVPLNDKSDKENFQSSSNSESEERNENDESKGFLRIHSEKIKKFTHRLSDKFQDSLDALKDVIKNDSLENGRKSSINDAYQDSSESSVEETSSRRLSLIQKKSNNRNYHNVPFSGSEDDDQDKSTLDSYIDIIDDGSQFEEKKTDEELIKSVQIERKISRLNSLDYIETPNSLTKTSSEDHIDFGPNPEEILSRLPHLKEEAI